MSCLKKFTLEYPIKSSIKILYDFLSTPESLAEWYSDEVKIKDGLITFKWQDQEQQARLVSKKDNDFVRYQWVEEHDHPAQFLEFKINIEPITNDLSLIITDFCNADEVEEQKFLWDMSINNLVKRIGGQ